MMRTDMLRLVSEYFVKDFHAIVNYLKNTSDIYIIAGVLLFIICIIVEYIGKKKKDKIKKECEARNFEVLDILYIPRIGRKNHDINIIFILKMQDDGKIYCARKCFSNINISFFGVANFLIKIKVRRKSFDNKYVELKVGDTGVCYIKDIVPFELKYNLNKNIYKEYIYAGLINEKNKIYMGEYCNANENENVIETLEELNQINGVVEFDKN